MTAAVRVSGRFSPAEDRAILGGRARGETFAAIGAALGRGADLVKSRARTLRERGVLSVADLDAAGGRPAKRTPPAEHAALRERVLDLRATGLSLGVVAARLGVTKGVAIGVCGRARKAGDPRAMGPGAPAGRPKAAPRPRARVVVLPEAPKLRGAALARARPITKRLIAPAHADAAAQKAAAERADAHAARMAAARPQTEAELRALIDRHLAEKGATPCPTMGQWDFNGVWETAGRR